MIKVKRKARAEREKGKILGEGVLTGDFKEEVVGHSPIPPKNRVY